MTGEGEGERTRPASPAAQERILRFQSLCRGALFAGRYEIRERIGSGGAGEVYRATDRTAGQDVALKVLFPGSDDRHAERLRRELRIVRTLQHPGIARIFDIGDSDGLLYMVSELLEGESLADRIRREGALPPAEAERILRRVLEALAVAHAAGVIHRDVKPANIFLERAGMDGSRRALLLDFGLARSLTEPGLTATGRFVGTPEYCSPEQIRGEKELTPATDLYACGITLWAMLSGRPPFRGNSEVEILTAHLTVPPPSPRREMPHAPARLRHLALDLLEKKPCSRPADAHEALRMLDRPVSLRRRGRTLRSTAGRLLTGRPLALAAVAGALALAMALLAFWLLLPVSARWRGKQVVWETRIGWVLASKPFPQPVASVLLSRSESWPFGATYVGLQGQHVDGAPMHATPPFPPMLHRIANPWVNPHPLLHAYARTLAWESCIYRGFDPAYIPSALVELPGVRPGSGPRLLVEAGHLVFYPSRLIGTDAGGRIWFSYDHPGRLPVLSAYPPGGDAPLILAGGTNNLLGPRSVVVALKAGEHGPGQAPPYTGPPTRHDDAVYYLFLPFDRQLDIEFHLEGDVGVVDVEHGGQVRFRASTGVPLDPSRRGGLSEDAWDARRRRLLEDLFEASVRGQTGDPEAGALILERFAAEGSGSPELLSIPLYRAALLRMQLAPRQGQAALARALEDISRACALEGWPHTPPRYLLLKADLLTRLGRKQEALKTLADWWSGSAQETYGYEWMLIGWRAGSDPSLTQPLSGFPEGSRREWPILIRLAHSARHRDLEAGRADAERLDALTIQWDIHHYWAARLYLDAPVPDPAAALAHLDRAKDSFKTGVHVPFAAARLHALLLRNPADQPSAAQVEEARRDLAETADCATTSVECLTLLEYGEQDLAAAARPGDSTAAGATER